MRMWIKTRCGNLINTNNIVSIELKKESISYRENLMYCEIWAYTGTIVPYDEGGFFYAHILLTALENEKQARNYLDKLAEKLGAEVIDIDQD